MMQPHFGNDVVYAGAELARARAAMILIHGRNAAPKNILDLLPRIDRPRLAAVAPAAAGGTWYPYSFLAEREQNEPGITSGLFVIESLVTDLHARGFPFDRIFILGFSQGACLTADFALRHPRRYGGVFILSGGLIGPPGTTWERVGGSLDGTPVFLGCSDADSHIPAQRVLESEDVFTRHGGVVTRRLYPGMGHLVSDDEIAIVQTIIDSALA